MMMSTLLMATANQTPPIALSPWYTSAITAYSVTEMPAPSSYIQKDSWLTATVTPAGVTETPTATQYYYQPTIGWISNDLITVSQVTESPTPTQYWNYA